MAKFIEVELNEGRNKKVKISIAIDAICWVKETAAGVDINVFPDKVYSIHLPYQQVMNMIAGSG